MEPEDLHRDRYAVSQRIYMAEVDPAAVADVVVGHPRLAARCQARGKRAWDEVRAGPCGAAGVRATASVCPGEERVVLRAARPAQPPLISGDRESDGGWGAIPIRRCLTVSDMTSSMRSTRFGRAAAWFVAGFLALFSIPNMYWGLGGKGGVVWVMGCDCLPPAAALIQQVFIIIGIIIILGRGGIWKLPLPDWTFWVGTWSMAVAFGAVAAWNFFGDNTLQARTVFAPVTAVLCVLCVVVARSPRRERPVSAI